MRTLVWFEPTDLTKAFRPFEASSKWRSVLSYATPNLNELKVMHGAILGKDIPTTAGHAGNLDVVLQESLNYGVPLIGDHLHTLLVTLGAQGVLLITNLPSGAPFPTTLTPTTKNSFVRAVHYPALKMEQIVSVSGAGDCFAAGMIASILQGLGPEACIQCGQRAATFSLASHLAVPHTINEKAIFSSLEEDTVPIAARSIFP
ncbi:hypothetical protein JTE90_014582 [Oedothorax gibbosus]|uniref:Carbohydrate kinase PfkB domain-containing protein n=1 Tax=Oedothorax gibbosus TaxID=931172 RepID=A0AAV6UL19_9ARAC|nr:hypothetical protein JTE90_014582 [Oedothorax gibbosus]